MNKVDFGGKIYLFFAGFFGHMTLYGVFSHNLFCLISLIAAIIMWGFAEVRFTEPNEK